MWLIRPAFQPAVVYPHIYVLGLLVLCCWASLAKGGPLKKFFTWVTILSAVAACLIILLAADTTARVRVLVWVKGVGNLYGTQAAFLAYSVLGIAAGLSTVFWPLLQRTSNTEAKAPGRSLLTRTDVRFGAFLAFNGFFATLPFLLATPLQVAVKTTDERPLHGLFTFKSDLKGKKYTLSADDKGYIHFDLLWNDIIDGDVTAAGFSHVRIDIEGHSVARQWCLSFPPPIGTTHLEQIFRNKRVDSREPVQAYLVGYCRVQAAMYSELRDKVGQLKQGYNDGALMWPDLPIPSSLLEGYLQADTLIAEAKNPRSPIFQKAKAAVGALAVENGKLRGLCDAIAEKTSGEMRDRALSDLCQLLLNSPSTELSWQEKRDAIHGKLDQNAQLFTEVAQN